MKRHAKLPVLIAAFMTVCSFGAVQFEPSIAEVIGKVRENIRQARNTLPDFVCTELYTSKGFENGKLKREKTIESLFTGLRETTNQGTISMKESREITAIDGKAVRKGTSMPDVPLKSDGMAAYLLTLSLDSGDAFDYASAGMEQVGTSRTLRIQFASNPNQNSVIINANKKGIAEKASGTAWVDLESMQVLRLDRQFLNLDEAATGIKTLSVSANYAKATLGGKEFWIPQLVRGEATLNSAKKTEVRTANYLAEYSRCRKFDVSIDLKF